MRVEVKRMVRQLGQELRSIPTMTEQAALAAALPFTMWMVCSFSTPYDSTVASSLRTLPL